jgi:hopanoid biosynthesis associated protein HpnK
MTRLIVHADDFGLTVGINNGIVKAHQQGILTSTSIIACGQAFDHAVELARDCPSLDIGVHLTLTGERPLSPPARIGTLIDEKCLFRKHISSLLGPLLLRNLSLEEVERELRAQIVKVLDHGIRVSHLDGHQHIHVLPGISRLVKELASEFSIPAIRYPRESLRLHMLKDTSAWGRLASQMLLNTFCRLSPLRTATHPEHFSGFYFGGRMNETNLIAALATLPGKGTVELMCHPGEEDASGAYGHWGYEWRKELDALISQSVKHMIETRHIMLVSYQDIPG